MSSYILCKVLRSLTPLHRKSIQHIGLKLLGTVNRAVPFQYSELIFCNSIRNFIAYANEANIVNKDSSNIGSRVLT